MFSNSKNTNCIPDNLRLIRFIKEPDKEAFW